MGVATHFHSLIISKHKFVKCPISLYSTAIPISSMSTQTHNNTLIPSPFTISGFASLSKSPVDVEHEKEEEEEKKSAVKKKMEVLGINITSCIPGHYSHLLCPLCQGGQSMEKSLSVHITHDESFAMWRCFRMECGWTGQAFADKKETHNKGNQIREVESSRHLTEETLGLEPLGPELAAYFAERKISEETLQRNRVMQLSAEKNVIAFTYRRNGEIVGCKYRNIEKKRFWQEKGREKIFYGLDDIKDAVDVIIVEGEIDKLSIEEVGFHNCISVPDGAPQKVSTKDLPSLDKDPAYRYLWNCKDYLKKLSRIILATDGDEPGQALAKELARRLGRERCWIVSWPEKDGYSFKDANDVLAHLGADVLKDIIQNAEVFQVNSSD